MKTNKLTNLAIAAILLFITSCNNEEVIGPAENAKKTYAPAIRATIGDFTDVNPAAKTKAGVVEEFENYRSDGERFYWQEGDSIKLLIFKIYGDTTTPVEMIYVANDPVGKKNSCGFTQVSGPNEIEAGEYDIYGIYPAGKWEEIEGESGESEALEVKMSGSYVQNGGTSTHLSKELFMMAAGIGVDIGEEENYVLDLKFEQITSVVRFRIIDEIIHKKDSFNGNLMLEYVKIYSKNSPFFITHSYFDGDPDIWSLKPVVLLDANDEEFIPYKDTLTVTVENGNFVVSGDFLQFDVFMPVLPTGPLEESEKKLVIEAGLKYDIGEGEQTYKHFFGTKEGLSFNDQLVFLSQGFKGGDSYWFDLKTIDPNTP